MTGSQNKACQLSLILVYLQKLSNNLLAVKKHMLKLNKATDEDFFKRWPEYWPAKEKFVDPNKATKKQYLAFKNIIAQKSSETEIEIFLRDNKEIVALITFLFSTGHHASWLFPKQHLRSPANNIGGKIPDYVVAAANSGGVSWY